MIPAVLGLASGTILLLSRGEDDAAPMPHETLPARHCAPLGLTQAQWMDFLRAATCGKPATITPSFRLGVFGMTVRRLCDLGAMADPTVAIYHGRQIWDAHWKDPANLRAFQAAPMLQYRLFSDSIENYAQSPEVVNAVGKTVEGKAVTKSGALMLAHRAGLAGMGSWLRKRSTREKFADNTTAFFTRANGIF
jgi:hypothetical protein